MSGRQTRGRQRIPISLIANRDDLYATFTKRRQGLYKKASEVSTLCGSDIGIIIFSPTGNPYSFFHPNMESVVDRYNDPNQQRNSAAIAVESTIRSRIDEMNRRLDEILEEKEQIKEHMKYLDEVDKIRQTGWWEQTPVESLNKQQVKEWMEYFQSFKAQVESQIEELRNGGSTSAFNPRNFPDAAGPSTGAGPSTYAPDSSYAPDPFVAGEDTSYPHQYLFPPLPHDGSGREGGDIHDQVYPSSSLDQFGGSGHFTSQFFFNSQLEDPFAGENVHHIPGQPFLPPPTEDPSTSGSSLTPRQSFIHPPTLNPSVSGESTQPIPGQYRHIPRGTRDASTVRGSRGDGSSDNQEQGGN